MRSVARRRSTTKVCGSFEAAGFAETKKSLLNAIAIHEQAPPTADLVISRSNLAELYATKARYEEAEALYRQVEREMVTARLPLTNIVTLTCNRAEMYLVRGQLAEAERVVQMAMDIADAQTAGESLQNGLIHTMAGIVADAADRSDVAQASYRKAEALIRSSAGASSPEYAAVLANYANLQMRLHRYQEAEMFYRRTLVIMEQLHGAKHAEVAVTVSNLARSLSLQKRYAEAEPLYRRALATLEGTLGSSHPEYAKALASFGNFFFDLGNYRAASDIYSRTLGTLRGSLGDNHDFVRGIAAALATDYRAQGRESDAKKVLQSFR